MTNHTLFTNVKIGDITLNNRIIMAPLTRMRAKQPQDVPHQLNATYYAQRASAGLIISEATQISPQGKGYPATPGIYSAEQIAGWKLITSEVHQKGGKIFLQLWHVGRISHFSLQPNNQTPVAPSAIPAKNSGTYTAEFKPTPILTPRALELHEIIEIIADYKRAAINAKEAGFDGVELHSANGYLLDQFLQNNSNIRTDNYGGPIVNRARLLLEILDEIIAVWGSGRVGVRLSPYGTFNDMADTNPIELFSYVIEQLSAKNIAYLHLIEPRSSTAGGSDAVNNSAPNVADIFKKLCKMPVISAGGYNLELAKQALDNKLADAVAFGRLFISNPDLPRRFLENATLNSYDRKTFYGGGEKGYTDYPFLD